MRKLLFFIFTALILSCQPVTPTPVTLEEKIGEILKPYILFGGMNQVSVAVFDGQEEHYFYFPDSEEVPAEPPLYAIGDLTQIFTSMAVGELILEGKISLNDTLDKFLPVIPSAVGDQKIRIRNLLSHTSGLRYEIQEDYRDLSQLEQALVYQNFQNNDFDDFLGTVNLPYPPGERYTYSRAGMGILGYTIGEVSGQSWFSFLSQRILNPLGMNDTRPLDFLTADQFARLQDGYSVNEILLTHHICGDYYGATSLNSTPQDLMKVLRAQLNPISALSDVFEFVERPLYELGNNTHLAAGWITENWGEANIYYQSGAVANAGFTGIIRDGNIAVVVLSDTPDQEGITSVGKACLKILYPF